MFVASSVQPEPMTTTSDKTSPSQLRVTKSSPPTSLVTLKKVRPSSLSSTSEWNVNSIAPDELPSPIASSAPQNTESVHPLRTSPDDYAPPSFVSSSLPSEFQEIAMKRLDRASTSFITKSRKPSAPAPLIQSLIEVESTVDASSVSGPRRRDPLARRNTYGPEFGHLDADEQFALETEIAARRAARRASKRRKEQVEDDDRVMIGTRIAEGHANYILMYNMLTGIRIGVGRVSAKPLRDLQEEDFRAAHKLAFDVTGNELTPGAKYDFKFKDYAPWVFRHLRQQFYIDPADYLVSLTSKYLLSELGSPGKSGSFFYYSRDYRFIIKTIHHTEHKFMRKILRDYYEHVCNNPNTLLCRFYGLHRVKLPHGKKIHFVVMGNVFPPNKDVHETYDLKYWLILTYDIYFFRQGSTFGRFLPDEEVQKKPYLPMKDLNWEKRNKKLELGPDKRVLFVEQIERDVELLERLNIMDYSLLVGLHNMERGNKENIRDTTLSMFQPETKKIERQASMGHHKRESKAQAVRKAIAQTEPGQLDTSLPDDPFMERRRCVFYADDGGFHSTDESNRPTNELYFIGIIDILTPYNFVKKAEHYWKSMSQDAHAISSVKPVEYGKRFLDFMINTLKHHEDVDEPQPHLATKKNV
ncbi:hypothetical protein BC938DRAFT_475182 [Jimgerdemannia flammicorona]|uniref:1-phosphatidylinositol-4-phosphate 5-kinase n=1 Tax=Jimgerdemannia flammicorona TaxID=994334 RepID=A0A433PZB2_9FUNG|nr:hypothetical protein BC938DRAFT_475182 [Jimgerdemannia flammicorona]